MINAYVIQRFPTNPIDPNIFDSHINDIKRINPNFIFVVSLGEINVKYIFHFLFTNLSSWLIENNKKIHVLWAGPDIEILPNIQGVNTLGSAVGNMRCIEGCKAHQPYINLADHTEKLFTCYNNNPKYERKYLVDQLVHKNLLVEGIITYHFPDSQMEYQWQYHDGTRLVDEPDYAINATPEFSAGFIPKNYTKGFVDIVCETDTQAGYFVPTEKTAKPLGMLKPFLVVSSVNYHQWLYDEYGLEKYDELFDYSFDSMPILEDRIHAIVQNLLNLKDKFRNVEYKKSVYEAILPKLYRNRERGINFVEILKSKNKVIPECLKFITQQEYQLHGDIVNNSYNRHFFFDKEWHITYG
jgi:hypothetical protein